jgi:tetratricopeptide (TPR) repeat protein
VFRRPLLVGIVVAASLAPAGARASGQGTTSAVELVRQAQEHEAQRDDFVAISRYTEALSLDPTLGEAYLGLGALRLRHGDAGEAERVYNVALARVPALARARIGRAEARWALGHRVEAEADLETYARGTDDPSALRELATWYGQESQTPAELATWRRIYAMAEARGDAALEHEARTMVRALQILVGGADPVTKPVEGDPVRRVIARVAQRGG